MPPYNTLNHRGREWGQVYLDPDPSLDEDVTQDVIWNMIDMHCMEKEKRDVNKKIYEAKIKMGKYASFGMFVGKQFKAEIESLKGRSNLAVLLLDFAPELKESPALLN